jgi:Sigma-70, region 4
MDAEPTPDARQEGRELHDLVWKALTELPVEQQETVQLHYVDGLLVWEIAALVGVPAGTVKARLHRARGRLRRARAAELGVPLERGGRREERTMIPVTVDDLIVRVPKDGDVRWIDIPDASLAQHAATPRFAGKSARRCGNTGSIRQFR